MKRIPCASASQCWRFQEINMHLNDGLCTRWLQKLMHTICEEYRGFRTVIKDSSWMFCRSQREYEAPHRRRDQDLLWEAQQVSLKLNQWGVRVLTCEKYRDSIYVRAQNCFHAGTLGTTSSCWLRGLMEPTASACTRTGSMEDLSLVYFPCTI